MWYNPHTPSKNIMTGDGTIDLGVGKITPEMSPEEKDAVWEKYWEDKDEESGDEAE